MRCPWALAALAALAACWAGCVSPREERLRDYAADGVFLFDKGQFAAAGEDFQAALTLKPDDVGLLYNLGECYCHRGLAQRAEHYYRECLARDSHNVPCRAALVKLLVQTGRGTEGAALIQDWLAREPKSADALALDGWYWHQAGDLPRAQTRLQQALDLEPQNSNALIELALTYEASQRPDRAAAIYGRVVNNDPAQRDVKKRLDALLTSGVKSPRLD